MDKKLFGLFLGLASAGLFLSGCSSSRCWNCGGKGNACCASADYPHGTKDLSSESSAKASAQKELSGDEEFGEPRKTLGQPTPYTSKSTNGWNDRAASEDSTAESSSAGRKTLKPPVASTSYQGTRWNRDSASTDEQQIRDSLPPLLKKKLASSPQPESKNAELLDLPENNRKEARTVDEEALDDLPPAPSVPALPPSLDR